MKKNLSYLIAAASLMLISVGAMAQGGLTPLVGSTHEYTVIADDDVNNTLTWAVTGGTAGTDFTVNSGAATEQVNITWLTAGTYTVTFTETNPTTSCATVKTTSVTVGVNTFDVSTSSPTAICNAADGQINYSGTDATSLITFTVNMTTASGFDPDWEIKFTLTPGTGTPTLSNVAASQGTLTLNTGVYTLTNLTSSTTGPVNGTVDITLDVTGDIYTVLTPDLEITSAKELTYNTPDKDSNDWTATQTINTIPNTSTITTD